MSETTTDAERREMSEALGKACCAYMRGEPWPAIQDGFEDRMLRLLAGRMAGWSLVDAAERLARADDGGADHSLAFDRLREGSQKLVLRQNADLIRRAVALLTRAGVPVPPMAPEMEVPNAAV